jgi:hypothetical protein
MTGMALDRSFYGSAFHAPRSASKNRKMFVVVARINHNDKFGALGMVRSEPDRRRSSPPLTGRPASADAVRRRLLQEGRASADQGRKTCRYHPGS